MTVAALIARILLCVVAANAVGDEVSSAKSQSCSWNDAVFFSDGWKIPRLSKELIKKHEEHYRYVRKAGEGTHAYDAELTVLVPSEPQAPVSIPIYSLKGGQLEIRDRLATIKSVWRFEKGGRVFAYGVEYQWVAVEKDEVLPLGAVTQRSYYDLKGEGKFQLMTDNEVMPFLPPIPDWLSEHR
jgi:hypothetical protein